MSSFALQWSPGVCSKSDFPCLMAEVISRYFKYFILASINKLIESRYSI